MKLLRLPTLKEITDIYVRKAFQEINDFLDIQSFLKGNFKHFEITVDAAVTNQKFKHNLGFLPKDIILTWIEGTGGVTWNYDLFDSTNIVFSTTKAGTIRFFLGRYNE